MNQDEQYAELMRDEEADYRYQQQVEEWQYYDHFKPEVPCTGKEEE